EDPIGVLRQGGPSLLSVDDVMAVFALSRSSQRGQIRARTRLGKSLAPPDIEIGYGRQKTLLLRLRAESDDHRPDHSDAKAERLRRRGLLQFFLEYVLLHGRPAGAAPCHRPVGDRPALGVEDALPGGDVVLGQMLSFDQLGADALRQIGA